MGIRSTSQHGQAGAGEATQDQAWLQRERRRQVQLRGLEALCRRLTASGRHELAIEAGRAAVAGEPLRESPRRALISALVAAGHVDDAWREHESFAALLADELGIAPTTSMEALGRALRAELETAQPMKSPMLQRPIMA